MIRKKVFIGGVNTDDADFLIDTKQFIGGLNLRFATSRLGDFGKVQNIEGTREITQTAGYYYDTPETWSLPAGNNTTIGAIEDPIKQRVYFFNKNSNADHAIYAYDLVTGLIFTVIENDDLEFGLEFDNDIHSIDVYGDLLYWTDNVEWQKRINTEAGIKAYHQWFDTDVEAYDLSVPMPNSVITLIRNQPSYAPTVEKITDGTFLNNFIEEGAFQFQYRFVYRDGEESTLSVLSELINYNLEGEGYNAITVTIPEGQKINQDVLRVDLVVKYLPLGNAFVIKTWDKEVSDEADEIEDHNDEIAELEYTFYNSTIGTALDQAYYTKKSDAVPRASEALAVGKNKLFLGNNLDGYNTPKETSMVIAASVSDGVDVTGTWYALLHWTDITHTLQDTIYFVRLQGTTSNNGYYDYATAPPPPFPDPVDYVADLVFVATDLPGILTALSISELELISFTPTGDVSDVTTPPPVDGVEGTVVFKSDAEYRTGIVFYDEAGRECGVVTKESLKINTIDRTYDDPAYTTSIDWGLSNANALTEIPNWAWSYAPVIQKCQRTRFFIQSRVKELLYIKYDTDGAYTTDTAYSDDHAGLGINIGVLTGLGLGYTFQANDIVKLYDDSTSTIYRLKVRDTFGQYIVVDLVDVGTLPGTFVPLVEIYSPYFPSTSEPYFEVGQKFPITNPGESTRIYSTLSGQFKGDITVIERTLDAVDYLAEAMSPNDTIWMTWNTHHGRACFVTKFGEQRKTVNVVWSNQSIYGTKVNGFSTFDALDSDEMPAELATLRKLILVDKIESEGNIMLGIGEKQTVSIYLGETQVHDNGTNTFLSTTTGTIGTKNTLKGGYGTINPESVSVDNGKVYWFDAIRGCSVAYSSNGLFATSSYKMFKFHKRMGELVREGGLKVYGGYDGFHDEALFFYPHTTHIPQGIILEDVELNAYEYESTLDEVSMPDIKEGRVYKLELPAYTTASYMGEEIIGDVFMARTSILLTLSTSSIEPRPVIVTEILRSLYEPFDGHGGVEAFSANNDMWVGKRSFRPQWFASAGNNLVSFYDGKIFIHDDTDNYNTFYDVEYDSIIAGIHNDDGNAIKLYRSVSIEGDLFDIMHFRTEKPNVQSTDLYANEFKTREGLYRAGLKRDRLSPNDEGTYDEKLFTGDEMKGEVLKFQGVFLVPTTFKSVKFVNIKFDPSFSHTE